MKKLLNKFALGLIIFLLIYFINYFIKTKQQRLIIVVSSGTIVSGDTLIDVLNEQQLNKKDINGIILTINSKYNSESIKPGDIYEIHKTTFNKVLEFIYKPNPVDSYYVLSSTETKTQFICEKRSLQLEKIITKTTGYIQTTLYDAMIKNGFDPETIMKFTDIFSWQIDFLTEVRTGDEYKVIYEQFKYKNNVIYNGKILAAQYNGKCTSLHTGILFEYPDGSSDYYDIKGNSLRKQFLKAPLNFRRISSYFSYSRFHPILRYFRPHLGIDYAAPLGTPVVSIGNGTIIFCGLNKGFGKQIIIKHNSEYATYYGHLSKFAKGIKKGKHIKQGKLIGYVGATGLATGPHLDFRITKYGKFINFLKLKIPSGSSVDKKYLKEFNQVKDNFLKILQ